MDKMIEYTPTDEQSLDFMGYVVIDKILHISKDEDKGTVIHLVNGEKLYSDDSMKTLQARINSLD